MAIDDEGLRIETPSSSLKKREIKEQDKKMKAAESIEANCFSELCNDHTALNMDSFEERDLSASYPSAQTSLNNSYLS